MSIPKTGGSFVRKPDGTLQRVAFTEPRKEAPAPAPQSPAKTTAAPDAPADTSKTNPKG
ncbi:hypothetical protein [Inquilinus limosus]|uniref:hypothetical protein n=1 Tax=Inquilinus limosus TaxID=171674 RepID=UPI001377EC06|nr:hypothetical protein [Inquilinus limosus]